MFSSLGVSEVGAVILVDCETQTTLEGADMIFEEVGVFVEVDGLKSEFPESFSTICVGSGMGRNASATELGSCSILIVHLLECEAKLKENRYLSKTTLQL